MAARFKEKYTNEIRPAIAKELGIENAMAIPKLEKIIINMGLGEATQNVKIMDPLVADLGAITGQKPVVTKAKKSIAAFKVREGMPIGAMVTLRGDKMYEFLDRPVTGLDQGGRFLVWSMRTWVSTMGEGQCPVSAIAPAFARWGMMGGLAPFHKAMLTFNRDGREKFGFCALACNHISEHEAIILSLVCALCGDRPHRVRDTLALLVDEDGIADALGALAALGRAMDEAGIYPARMSREPPGA